MQTRPGRLRQLDWLIARPVAHRGLHDAENGVIENTSCAVEAALAGGYAIEVDLQLTGDGEAVVFHDYSLDRLTTSTGKLLEQTTTQIQSAQFRACGDRIQTLGELLDQVDGKATLLIELKANWRNPGPLEKRVAAVLDSYSGPVGVMSFDPRSIAILRNQAPQVVRGLTTEKFRIGQGWRKLLPVARRLSLRHMAEFGDADPHFAAINVQDLPCAPSRRFLARGLPVLTWTVRTTDERSRASRFADQMIFEGFHP